MYSQFMMHGQNNIKHCFVHSYQASPQIARAVTWDRTRACIARGRRLTAWTVAPPLKSDV